MLNLILTKLNLNVLGITFDTVNEKGITQLWKIVRGTCFCKDENFSSSFCFGRDAAKSPDWGKLKSDTQIQQRTLSESFDVWGSGSSLS